MAVLPIGISGEEGGYQIERSLRFNSADTPYLGRTFTTPTNNKKFTWSGWVKRTGFLATAFDFAFLTSASNAGAMGISGTGAFGASLNGKFFINIGSYAYVNVEFRDPSAWYHFVCVVDTDNATANDRQILYVNGVRQPNFSATYSSGASPLLNTARAHFIGGYAGGGATPAAGYYANGYLSEVNFIDGQALDPTSFGEYNSETGVWQPKAYTGSYGTNGFYLNFSDNSNNTAATLGKDYSGNGNNWTPNLFSVTAGAGNDSMVDVPTLYGTDAGNGGEVRGNYATWNPLDKDDGISSVTEGNLKVVTNGSNGSIKSTIAFPSGKWYWEVTSDSISGSGTQAIGIMPQSQPPTNNMSDSGKLGYAIDASFSDRKFENGTATSYGSYTQANGAVYMLAFDQDAGKLWYGVNGTWLASGDPAAGTNPSSSSISTSTAYCAAVSDNTVSGTFTVNFGQRPFAYTAPSGFKALCTQNLPEPTVVDGGEYFNTIVWNGNTTSSQAITGVGFQPDLVWAKSTDANSGQDWVDAVRGATKNIQSHNTLAESTSNTVISFQSDGFTVGDGLGYDINKGGEVIIGRCWKANGAGVSVSAGDSNYGSPSLASTVSANTTAGFSIVKWIGNITTGATVAHGLGVAPSMVMYFNRDGASHPVYHKSVGATKALFSNLLSGGITSSTYFNDIAPSPNLLTLGDATSTNGNGTNGMVAYCFAPVEGYSAFGSYNGATTKVFVYLGFRPAFVLLKKYGEDSTTYGWPVVDNLRPPTTVGKEGYNPTLELWMDQSVAEATSSSYGIDLLSNGFCINEANNTNVSGSGKTYVYAAFAENPFKYSLAR